MENIYLECELAEHKYIELCEKKSKLTHELVKMEIIRMFMNLKIHGVNQRDAITQLQNFSSAVYDFANEAYK